MKNNHSKYCSPLPVRNPGNLGGKANNLSTLLEHDLPVPPTLVITQEVFSRFIQSLSQTTHEFMTKFSNILSSIMEASRNIENNIRNHGIPDTIFIPVYRKIIEHFGECRLIFRSSAAGEDSSQASFAGQLDSIVIDTLALAHKEACRQALLESYVSFYNSRCITYQINKESLLYGFSVIVQPYIEAELAGVLFTKTNILNDSNPGSSPMLLESVQGACEGLVSGKVTPMRYYIYVNGMDCKILPVNKNTDKQLSDNNMFCIKQLTQYAIQCRSFFNDTHQDIEWLIDKAGKLWIVQSRPITTIKDKSSSIMHIWTNTNVNENFPEPLTPFLISFTQKGYYHYFKNLAIAFGVSRQSIKNLEIAFSQIIDFHCGRMYYNLSHIYECLNALPFPALIRKYWDSFIGIFKGQHTQEDNILPMSPLSKILYIIKILIYALKNIIMLPFYIRRFESRANSFVKKNSGQKSLQDLQTALRGFINIRMNKWKDASLADALALFGYGFLCSVINEFAPAYSGSLNTFLTGLPDVVSTDSQTALFRLRNMILREPELRVIFMEKPANEILHEIMNNARYETILDYFNRYCHEWGFRISGELLMVRKDYSEEPEKLIELLSFYLNDGIFTTNEQIDVQMKKRKSLENELFSSIKNSKNIIRANIEIKIIKIVLYFSHSGIRYRERARLKQAQLYNRCRHILIDIGYHLANKRCIDKQEDIFFLRYDEIININHLVAPSLIQSIVAKRKAEYLKNFEITPPDDFILPENTYFDPDDLENKTGSNIETFNGEALRGIIACEGKVDGIVRILKDISEIQYLQKGDILVVRQTDPGWSPAFPLIGGLVLERGGMLSHGAIIAREYGIPALIGVDNATNILKNGEHILLNANDGFIKRMAIQ